MEQSFPARLLAQNRKGSSASQDSHAYPNQVDDENHPQSRDTDRNVVAAPYETFPNTRFTSRDTTAIDNSRLVTDLVTANGNRKTLMERLADARSLSK